MNKDIYRPRTHPIGKGILIGTNVGDLVTTIYGVTHGWHEQNFLVAPVINYAGIQD